MTVQRLLVRRLGEELRGVEILALNGHGFQAISAAASVFEQSHFLTYAASDEEVAEKYLNWSDHTKSVATVQGVVEKSGRARGWSKARAKEEYEKYRFLCGFKHNNAFMQRILLHPKDSDVILAQLSISDACWFTLTSMGLVAALTLSNNSAAYVLNHCNEIMDAVKDAVPRLSQDAV